MKEQLLSAEVLVCIGTGGVGKTTLSAALGYMLAEQGKRVLVLTVDPAQRLKTTFRLETAGEWIKVKEFPNGGVLSAALVDARKTFDAFVLRAAEKDPSAAKLFENRLYQQLTTSLAGSQEFTSLESLLSARESGQFDVIVLDTPPAQHASEFLSSPQKLASIFNEGVARWFRDPGGRKENFWMGLMQTGTKQVLKILERLTGNQFVRELADFFQKIHSWQDRLESRAVESHRLLVSPKTHFLMITTFDEAKLKEATVFADEVRKTGYQLSGVIVNRAFPRWVVSEGRGTDKLQNQFADFFDQRRQFVNSFAHQVAPGLSLWQLPEQTQDIADLAAVAAFAKIISKESLEVSS